MVGNTILNFAANQKNFCYSVTVVTVLQLKMDCTNSAAE